MVVLVVKSRSSSTMCGIGLTKVVNMASDLYTFYIGRGSDWGNPFRVGVHGTRSEVIELYRIWMLTTKTKADILALQGETLGCFCKPKACHGDVIVNEIERLSSPLTKWI